MLNACLISSWSVTPVAKRELSLAVFEFVIGYSLTNRPLGKVQKIEGCVERLVASTHEEQHGLGSVVQTHDWVLGHVNELVARLPLQH
jgi:hypothetical protein